MIQSEGLAIQVERIPLVDFELLRPPPEWVVRGACKSYDPDFMFPKPDENGRTDYKRQRIVCNGCPVKDLCREYGMDEPYGMFGGTSPKQRKKMGRGRGQPEMPGGMIMLAKRQHTKREDPCSSSTSSTP